MMGAHRVLAFSQLFFCEGPDSKADVPTHYASRPLQDLQLNIERNPGLTLLTLFTEEIHTHWTLFGSSNTH